MLHTYMVDAQGIARGYARACVCVYDKQQVVFFYSLHSMTSRACTQFRGYLKNQRQTKTPPPPTPPPIQRGRAKRMRRGKAGGCCLNTGLDKAVKKRAVKEKSWMKRERTSQRHPPKTRIECMCLLSQLITLYRGHGLALYTTYKIKWKGMRCQLQLQLVFKIWMNLIRHPWKPNCLCRLVIQIPAAKRGLSQLTIP